MKTSQWNEIYNAVTGEIIRFISRDAEADSVTFEYFSPAGSGKVIEHRHPGWEKFEVRSGTLTLTVNGQPHPLGPGEEFTITSEWHFPANLGTEDVVAVVSASPAALFERGLRALFGLYSDDGANRWDMPRDMLAVALLSEKGKFQAPGPPRWLWVSLMTGLGWVAVLAGKRRKLERYWPPELERPWKARRAAAAARV